MGGRWVLISKFLSSSGFQRTEQEVIAKTKEMSAGQSLKSMGSTLESASTFVTPKAKAEAAKAAEAKPKPAAKAKADNGKEGSAPPQAAPPAASETSSEEWSVDQQKALETALQKHPASLDNNERWRLIAADVPGKTKAQCVERFKFLREQLSSKQKKITC